MFIDTHCHFEEEDWKRSKEIIERAKQAGVRYIFINGHSVDTNKKIIENIDAHRELYGLLGYGPSEANKISEKDFLLLEKQLENSKIIGIGEIGIDLYWEKSNLKEQIYLFERQLDLAVKYKMPVIIHNREADDIIIRTLEKYRGKIKGVMHCFNSRTEIGNKLVDLGFLMGIGGILTFSKQNLEQIIKVIELENMVLETDSPYLSPSPRRGKRNEPRNLKYIASKIGEIKGLSTEKVGKITSQNALSLFDLEGKLW